MSCYFPLQAFQAPSGGPVSFAERKGYERPIELPCGQCIGCKTDRARSWAARIMHEASLYPANAFVTLTYEKVPLRPSLDYKDFQLFMRRYRRSRWYFDKDGKLVKPKSRFFVAGEYGEKYERPHFHAILFDCSFPDMFPVRRTVPGCEIFRAPSLEKLWPHGFSSFGMVTYESARYVAQYCVKKVTGPNSYNHYSRVDEFGEYELAPEFARMSLRPGIGSEWFEKFGAFAGRRDSVVMDGVEIPMPRYYDKLHEIADPWAAEENKSRRELDAIEKWEDNTSARLEVKAAVAKSKVSKRNVL